MRVSNWVISALFVVFLASAVLSATPSSDQGIAERIAVQEARLSDISQGAARRREQVEQWYESRRMAIARDIGRPAAARLCPAERALWTEFAKMSQDVPYAAGYFDASHYGFPFRHPATLLRQAMIEEYFVSEMARLLLNGDFEQRLSQIVGERLRVPLEPLLRDQAEELLTLVRQLRLRLNRELRELEDEKKARLDATMRSEEELKEQVRSILDYLRKSESREARFGVVESVGYCPGSGYFCMIEGVGRVLGTDDMIGNVRVVSIDAGKVEFAKDGTTWAQELGAPAQPYWD